VLSEGRVVAVGVGAAHESGWAGMHGMRTAPDARRRGCAQAIVVAAAAVAHAAGARGLYLQVDAGNAAARALYRKLGFAEAYSYAYWRAR